ncbi:MAG: hypothetical protein SAJ37_15885 [Oscillatoria sp. PMC 1068.18]|nr:hypothetical protein [Oscillatoria sp. PMC 1076.18]MEC4990213.1 hypothetical protein [Oscillatoria sp. PMC 1068.18]
MNKNTGPEKEVGTDVDTYDRNIVPAETAARKEREKENYKQKAENEKAEQEAGVSTTDGYTTDKEGLANNYAIEPEMYVNQPGDMREKEEQEKAQRAQELQNINEGEEGKLTKEEDRRSKGPGKI